MTTRAHRTQVKKWRSALRPVGADCHDLRKLHALDVAKIESGIYGMLAQYGCFETRETVQNILYDILSSYGEPEHWRNREPKLKDGEREKTQSDTPLANPELNARASVEG